MKKLWTEEQHYEKARAFSTAWSLYLENMAYIIIEWRRNTYNDCEFYIQRFNSLQEAFQQCFNDIASDFSATAPKFIHLQEDQFVPLVLL
jgi:hypothetical protein